VNLKRPAIVLSQIGGAGRKREFDSFGFEGAHNLQVYFFTEFHKLPVIRGKIPVYHHNVQGGVVELIENDPRRKVRLHAFVVVENTLDNRQGLFDLFGRCIIRNGDVCQASDGRTLSDVFDI